MSARNVLIAGLALLLLAVCDWVASDALQLAPAYVLLAFSIGRFASFRQAAIFALAAIALLMLNRLPVVSPSTSHLLANQSIACVSIALAAMIRSPARDEEAEPIQEFGVADAESEGQGETITKGLASTQSHGFLIAHDQRCHELHEMSVRELVHQFDESPVVSPAYVKELVSHDPNLLTPASVAAYLTRKQLLTTYQQHLLCAGHGAELSLGDYWVLNRLGAGGAAIVLHARHKHLGLEYAIKVMAPRKEDSDRLRRTELEMQASSELLHPNIVVVRETGEEKGVYFIVMEWVNGRTLQSMVSDFGPLSLEESLDFTLQAARGLAFAHDRGFVHRDVKPGNLMVDRRGVLKVVDMGLVGVEESKSSTQSSRGGIFGTIDYMSPEQAQDFSSADQRSDIYSLGGTFFFLLTGTPLLSGKTDQQKLSNVIQGRGRRSVTENLSRLPPNIVEVVKKMTARRPDRRFDSMHDVVANLQEIVDESGIDVRRFDHVRVLIVEDDAVQRALLSHLLKESNCPFQLTFAKRIVEASDLIRKKSYDAALVDLSLPDSAGVESVASIRATDPTLPIVVLTGSDDTELGRECIRAGADDFYSKAQLTRSGLERRLLLSLSRRQAAVG